MSDEPCTVCAKPGCVPIRHDEVLSHEDALRFAKHILTNTHCEVPRTTMLARYIVESVRTCCGRRCE